MNSLHNFFDACANLSPGGHVDVTQTMLNDFWEFGNHSRGFLRMQLSLYDIRADVMHALACILSKPHRIALFDDGEGGRIDRLHFGEIRLNAVFGQGQPFYALYWQVGEPLNFWESGKLALKKMQAEFDQEFMGGTPYAPDRYRK